MIDRLHAPLLERAKIFGAAAGILFAWTLVEHQFIEPLGIDRYLPYYRVNGMCVWDVFVLGAIVTFFVRSRVIRTLLLVSLLALGGYFVMLAAGERREGAALPAAAAANAFVGLKPCGVPGLRERIIAQGGDTVAYAGEFVPVPTTAWTQGPVRIYLYVVSGAGVVRVGSSARRVGAGDFIVIPKGVRHAVNASQTLHAIYVESAS